VVASKPTSSHAHILSSSKSLLSLFGSKAAAERIPTEEGSNSASCMVEFPRKASGYSSVSLFSHNNGMRSSTTVLDSLKRVNRSDAVGGAPSGMPSGRSGRIGFDSIIRNPIVDHRIASNVHSQPLVGNYLLGSQTLKHPTARSTKSGIYESFNQPLSPREGLYRRRRSYDEDDINFGEHLPYHPRDFPPKPSRRCK